MPPRAHNLLSFDIEGFIESSLESRRVPARCISASLEAREIEANTAKILEVLAEFDQKATFFILGRIARDHNALVKRISEAGHEIGCHSYYHKRLYDLSFDEVQTVVWDAKKRLEDVSGQQVYGFRAPDFSVVKSNLWLFDVLLEAGYRYDSSIMPTSLHDVYGIGSFPPKPMCLLNGLVEVPLSTIRIGRWRLPPRISGIGWLNRFRTYTGITTARKKLRSLLRSLPFSRIIDYLVERDMVSVQP